MSSIYTEIQRVWSADAILNGLFPGEELSTEVRFEDEDVSTDLYVMLLEGDDLPDWRTSKGLTRSVEIVFRCVGPRRDQVRAIRDRWRVVFGDSFTPSIDNAHVVKFDPILLPAFLTYEGDGQWLAEDTYLLQTTKAR